MHAPYAKAPLWLKAVVLFGFLDTFGVASWFREFGNFFLEILQGLQVQGLGDLGRRVRGLEGIPAMLYVAVLHCHSVFVSSI